MRGSSAWPGPISWPRWKSVSQQQQQQRALHLLQLKLYVDWLASAHGKKQTQPSIHKAPHSNTNAEANTTLNSRSTTLEHKCWSKHKPQFTMLHTRTQMLTDQSINRLLWWWVWNFRPLLSKCSFSTSCALPALSRLWCCIRVFMRCCYVMRCNMQCSPPSFRRGAASECSCSAVM